MTPITRAAPDERFVSIARSFSYGVRFEREDAERLEGFVLGVADLSVEIEAQRCAVELDAVPIACHSHLLSPYPDLIRLRPRVFVRPRVVPAPQKGTDHAPLGRIDGFDLLAPQEREYYAEEPRILFERNGPGRRPPRIALSIAEESREENLPREPLDPMPGAEARTVQWYAAMGINEVPSVRNLEEKADCAGIVATLTINERVDEALGLLEGFRCLPEPEPLVVALDVAPGTRPIPPLAAVCRISCWLHFCSFRFWPPLLDGSPSITSPCRCVKVAVLYYMYETRVAQAGSNHCAGTFGCSFGLDFFECDFG